MTYLNNFATMRICLNRTLVGVSLLLILASATHPRTAMSADRVKQRSQPHKAERKIKKDSHRRYKLNYIKRFAWPKLDISMQDDLFEVPTQKAKPEEAVDGTSSGGDAKESKSGK